MKVTKNQVNNIIKEEIVKLGLKTIIQEEAEKLNLDLDDEAEVQLKGVIEKLIKKFDELDISIDFLASVFAGADPLNIGAAQTKKGRYYSPRKTRTSVPRSPDSSPEDLD